MAGFGRLGVERILTKVLWNTLSQVGTGQHETSKNSDYSHPLVRNSYVGRRPGINPEKYFCISFYPGRVHLIPKWWQYNFPFIFMLISPLYLDCTYRSQKKFYQRSPSLTVLSIYYFFVYKFKLSNCLICQIAIVRLTNIWRFRLPTM